MASPRNQEHIPSLLARITQTFIDSSSFSMTSLYTPTQWFRRVFCTWTWNNVRHFQDKSGVQRLQSRNSRNIHVGIVWFYEDIFSYLKSYTSLRIRYCLRHFSPGNCAKSVTIVFYYNIILYNQYSRTRRLLDTSCLFDYIIFFPIFHMKCHRFDDKFKKSIGCLYIKLISIVKRTIIFSDWSSIIQ